MEACKPEQDERFTERQVDWLRVIIMIILIIYGLTALLVLDTVRIQFMYQKKMKSVNLYLFYLLAIIVCIGRYYSMIILFRGLTQDTESLFDYHFNYGVYTSIFAIILIALTQINSINSATLKTRYVNEYTKGSNPPIKKLQN